MKYQTAAVGEPLCAAWNPDGKGEFLTGHSSGLIHTWSDKEPQPKVDNDGDGAEGAMFELCEPVTRLEYYGAGGGVNSIVIHDGGPTALDPSVHHVTIGWNGGKQKQKLVFDKEVLGFASIGNDSPWSVFFGLKRRNSI